VDESQQTAAEPDTIGACRIALSDRVLPTPATTPARPIDDGGSCKNRWLDYCNSLFYGFPDRTLHCASCSLCRTPLHDLSLARDVMIISCRYYANSIGYPSDSVSSSKWHVLFASRCPGRRVSTIAASCVLQHSAFSMRSADVPTCVVLRTLSNYGDRTFAAAGPRLWSSLPVQLRNPHITLWTVQATAEGTPFFGKHEHGAL